MPALHGIWPDLKDPEREVVEYRPRVYWDSYLDYAGSERAILGTQMRLFNTADPRRSNLRTMGHLPHDFELSRVGLRLDFSDRFVYKLAFRGLRFQLIVGDRMEWDWDAGMHVGVDPFALPKDDPVLAEEYDYVLDSCGIEDKGFCSFIDLPEVIPVPERMRFELIMDVAVSLRDFLSFCSCHSSGPDYYAEIKVYLVGIERLKG